MFRRRPVIAALGCALVMAPGLAQERESSLPLPAARLSIAMDRGRVTAVIESSPLLAVLEELSRRTRVTIVPGPGLEAEELSAELTNVPVDEAIRTLLKNYDTFLYYSPSQQSPASLAAVWVYPRGAASSLRPVPVETWASTRDLEAAMADRDPAVRERAYEALMARPDRVSQNRVLLAIRGATEADSELRERLLSTALSRSVEIPREVLSDLVRVDGTEAIRLIALDALTGDPAARETAVAALTDPSEAVRDRAREFLTELDSLARRRDR